jgi:AraC-like DNA-binding protein
LNKSTQQILDIRGVIVKLLPGGHPSLTMVAAQLDMSPRTLQRRLAENGLTHSQILHQTRLTKACQRLVKVDVHISDIARETGFASPSSFSRAFQSWTGTTPRAFRKNCQANSSLALNSHANEHIR